MADEHKRKHKKHNLGGENDETLHKNKYGFIEIDNPEYYNNNYNFSPPEYLMRKPTPFERREMVINYIIRNNGKPINISTLASSLAVSVRTMQTLLHSLQKGQNYRNNAKLHFKRATKRKYLPLHRRSR